ncbi:MAG: DUF5605 domain-containing protein [Rhizomicrobium sp.]
MSETTAITRRTACGLAAAAGLSAWAKPAFANGETLRAQQWGVVDIVLPGPSDGTPDAKIWLSATFKKSSLFGKDVEHSALGFYDGSGAYRIRFSPPEPGTWSYLTRSNNPALDRSSGKIEAAGPAPGNHGPVRVADSFHFAYADGTPFRPIGTTSYGWIHQPADIRAQTLQTLAAAPFNKIRMLVFPNGSLTTNEALYPFMGVPNDWDYDRFNPEFFHRLEDSVAALEKLGIEADIILFHPYDEGRYGFDALPDKVNARYIEHLIARLAPYHNVWWSVANEFDLMHEKTMGDFDHYFEILQAHDTYNHLRSIHHMRQFYNNAKPWVTHSSIQSGAIAEDDERAMLLRDVWNKPVVLDEVKYEGNYSARWGQLNGKEMTSRFWFGTIAGVYVSHGEFIEDAAHHMWVGTGGQLRGTSAPRIAFLRKILEASPRHGLDPIDKWQDHHIAGVAGKYYLKYFGDAAPKDWTFSLPKAGLEDGDSFTVDILDSWNMTITPVAGKFTVTAQGAYDFADQDGRSIALPGKPWIALRIQKV